jgi:hypothetical protein
VVASGKRFFFFPPRALLRRLACWAPRKPCTAQPDGRGRRGRRVKEWRGGARGTAVPSGRGGEAVGGVCPNSEKKKTGGQEGLSRRRALAPRPPRGFPCGGGRQKISAAPPAPPFPGTPIPRPPPPRAPAANTTALAPRPTGGRRSTTFRRGVVG